MMKWASRWSGGAVAALTVSGLLMAVSLSIARPAAAGELAAKASEAETLLASGKTADAAAALDAAVDSFWQKAPLLFRTALFVDSAKGYGDYTPRAGAIFGPDGTLQVYAEPVFFGWTEVAGSYRIGFSTEVEIRDNKGLVLTRAAAPAILERTLKEKSREFQITLGFPLPKIKAGNYVLVLKVTDTSTAKMATIELPFTVIG